MKVSWLVFELTAIPDPRAVLTRSRLAPMLSNTAYPTDFWISSLDDGSSLYRSSKGCAAILRVFSRCSSGVSLATARPPANKTMARLEAIILNLMRFSKVSVGLFVLGYHVSTSHYWR